MIRHLIESLVDVLATVHIECGLATFKYCTLKEYHARQHVVIVETDSKIRRSFTVQNVESITLSKSKIPVIVVESNSLA